VFAQCWQRQASSTLVSHRSVEMVGILIISNARMPPPPAMAGIASLALFSQISFFALAFGLQFF
jgi:hypothetical protein